MIIKIIYKSKIPKCNNFIITNQIFTKSFHKNKIKKNI